MSLWKRLLQDPPPGWIFEISPRAIALARPGTEAEIQSRGLPEETLTVTPQAANIAEPAVFAQAVREMAPPPEDRRKRRAALILPDFSVRLTVLEFDQFPSATPDQTSLVKHRLRRAVPFDIESAALSFTTHPRSGKAGTEVVAAVAPREVIDQYEQPFLDLGFHPGHITTSLLAMLPVIPANGLSLVAKVAGGILTLALVQEKALKLARTLPLNENSVEEISGHIYPTVAYAEDNLGAQPDRICLAGFGNGTEQTASTLSANLLLPVEPVRSKTGQRVEEHDGGLWGYLAAVA